MLAIAIGQSEEPDTKEAIAEVLAECRMALNERKPKAGLLFASAAYDFQAILEEIEREYPGIPISGCSSFGEITSKKMVKGGSIALMLLDSEMIDIRAALASGIASQEKEGVSSAVKESLKGLVKSPSLCLTFADGLVANVSEVIEGVQEGAGSGAMIIAGGGACDEWEFKKVHLFNRGKVASNAASMLFFSQPVKCSLAVRHGRQPLQLNTRPIVTKSHKNIVYTIDNMTALDFYKKHLGEYANYEAYALLIFLDDPERYPDKYLVRAPFKIDHETGAIAFPGDVPQNSPVGISQLSSRIKTLEAAKDCVKKALETFTGEKIDLCLVFSCALRKEILGTDTVKELDIITSELPKGVPLFGYYTFGEIGHYDVTEQAKYYNETIVVVLIGE